MQDFVHIDIASTLRFLVEDPSTWDRVILHGPERGDRAPHRLPVRQMIKGAIDEVAVIDPLVEWDSRLDQLTLIHPEDAHFHDDDCPL
jgi:hypothetical protein